MEETRNGVRRGKYLAALRFAVPYRHYASGRSKLVERGQAEQLLHLLVEIVFAPAVGRGVRTGCVDDAFGQRGFELGDLRVVEPAADAPKPLELRHLFEHVDIPDGVRAAIEAFELLERKQWGQMGQIW